MEKHLPNEGWVTPEDGILPVESGDRHCLVASRSTLWKSGMEERVNAAQKVAREKRQQTISGSDLNRLYLDAAYDLGWVRYTGAQESNELGIDMGSRDPHRVTHIVTNVFGRQTRYDTEKPARFIGAEVTDWGMQPWAWQRGMTILFNEPMPRFAHWIYERVLQPSFLGLEGDTGITARRLLEVKHQIQTEDTVAGREGAVLAALKRGYIVEDDAYSGDFYYSIWDEKELLRKIDITPGCYAWFRLDQQNGYRWVPMTEPATFKSFWLT